MYRNLTDEPFLIERSSASARRLTDRNSWTGGSSVNLCLRDNHDLVGSGSSAGRAWGANWGQLSPYAHAEIRRHHNWWEPVEEGPSTRSTALFEIIARACRFRKRTPVIEAFGVQKTFGQLAHQWRNETMLLSSMTKKLMHPAYLRIIGLGPRALPLLLSELKREPAYWFRALSAISGDDPVPAGATFTQAVEAWLDWGRERHLI